MNLNKKKLEESNLYKNCYEVIKEYISNLDMESLIDDEKRKILHYFDTVDDISCISLENKLLVNQCKNYKSDISDISVKINELENYIKGKGYFDIEEKKEEYVKNLKLEILKNIDNFIILF